jgi:hypothetical protein
MLSLPCIADAQEGQTRFGDGRFEFRIGGQAFTGYETRLRIDSERLGLGTELTIEDELFVEDDISIGRVDVNYRFNQRHSIATSFYNIDRTGTRLTERDIGFGETFFPAGTPVESEFNQDVIKLAYRFRFIDRPRAWLSGSFGLHTLQLATSIRAFDGSLTSEQDADAPLPVFGVQGAYRFGEKWSFQGSTEWFDVQTGDFKGTFLDAILSLEHQTFDRFSLGFGLNRFNLDIESGDENLRGIVEVTYDAALIYFKGSFGSVD